MLFSEKDAQIQMNSLIRDIEFYKLKRTVFIQIL